MRPGRCKVWKVFAGASRISEALHEHGAQVQTFGLPDWDFYRKADRKAFMALLEAESQ